MPIQSPGSSMCKLSRKLNTDELMLWIRRSGMLQKQPLARTDFNLNRSIRFDELRPSSG